MFWDNTAHSGLMGLVVLGLPRDCTAIGGFTATLQWNYGVFSSTASSLVATHLRIGVGKVGVNLNVFGPNPVAHLRGNKFISISGEWTLTFTILFSNDYVDHFPLFYKLIHQYT